MSYDNTNPFARILRGELPCVKVAEDDATLAIMDLMPQADGHVLVIPKEPAETLDQLSDDSAAAIGRVLPRLSRAVLAATGARHFNVLQNNGAPAHQAVFHVHFHIIPKFDDAGLEIEWNAGKLADGGELAKAIAAKL
jgi:histidine triad (HIT) family protein